MKVFRGLLAVTLLLCTAALLHADPVVDPRMIVAGGGASFPVDTLTFSFSSNDAGGGFYGDFNTTTAVVDGVLTTFTHPVLDHEGFVNASGKNWVSLTITSQMYDNPGLAPLTLFADQFLFVQFTRADTLTVKFFGTDATHPGIPTGPDNPLAHFSIDLYEVDANGVDLSFGGWKRGGTGNMVFTVVAGASEVNVPEPGTLSLMLVGVLAVGGSLFRRRR